MMFDYYPYGFSYFGMFFMLVFWGLIIWLVIWLIKTYSKPSESALEILKKRYANGEMSKREFDQIKKDI